MERERVDERSEILEHTLEQHLVHLEGQVGPERTGCHRVREQKLVQNLRHHMDPAVDDGFVIIVEQKLEQHLGVYLVD